MNSDSSPARTRSDHPRHHKLSQAEQHQKVKIDTLEKVSLIDRPDHEKDLSIFGPVPVNSAGGLSGLVSDCSGTMI